jgi:hypothetical protein
LRPGDYHAPLGGFCSSQTKRPAGSGAAPVSSAVAPQRPRAGSRNLSHPWRRRSGSFSRQPATELVPLFSCGAGGTVLDFIAAMERCTLPEAARKLQPMVAMPATAPTSTAPEKPRVTKRMMPPAPLGFTLRGIDSTHPYLAGRGITQATAAEFGIGFYPGSGILSGAAGHPFPQSARRAGCLRWPFVGPNPATLPVPGPIR